MTGDARRRHCSSCEREVLHLSAMTAVEARRALAERPGERVCVRYACDPEDNIVFAAPRRGPLRAVVLVSALSGCAAGGWTGEPDALCDPLVVEVAEYAGEGRGAAELECEGEGRVELAGEGAGEARGELVYGGEVGPESGEVGEAPASCEPGAIALEGWEVEVEVAAERGVVVDWASAEVTMTMGVPATVGVAVMLPPLESAVPGPARPPEREAPRRVLPLESRMGALAPDLLAGLVPGRRAADE